MIRTGAPKVEYEDIRTALLIRKTEERFLDLFSQGRLNGTVHTCLGQELTAVAFAGHLEPGDFVFSNHRCHGHYIAFTGRYDRLIAELLGRRDGVCGGVGSSQHLCDINFFSNGVQGGIAPVAGGLALAKKFDQKGRIGVVFIGDGTLGEGAIYETLNLISLWKIPLLIVCEHNGWAQSTDAQTAIAGSVVARARAFGIASFESDVWDEENLFASAREAIDLVRTGVPAFHFVKSYRLGPHSKGDDNRKIDEIDEYRRRDRLSAILASELPGADAMLSEVTHMVDEAVERATASEVLSLAEYEGSPRLASEAREWYPLEGTDERVVDAINHFFKDELSKNPKAIFMGEDVLSPYGGAFKVARDLSFVAPDRVLSTPISEAAIVGFANGLALGGYRPYAEIMFGDFITLAFDQIVNHASKFRHMYNHQVTCPVVVRTPMGGRRGYGPTHSQSLDRFLLGIENVQVVATNALLDPRQIYRSIASQQTDPIIVIENKSDYGKKLGSRRLEGFLYEQNDAPYPSVRIRPPMSKADAIFITYGGMTDITLQAMERLFEEKEILTSALILSSVHPLPLNDIFAEVQSFEFIVTCEEGNPFAGFGSEVIAAIAGQFNDRQFLRIGARPFPIPSPRSLEEEILPSPERVSNEVAAFIFQKEIM